VANETRIFETKEIDHDCGGSLTITHAKEYDVADYESIRLGGDRLEFPNLKRGFPVLKETVVLHVEANGCNCWEVYDNPHFVGDKEDVVPGDRHYLNVRTGSVRKVECTNFDFEDDK
jgi:hypothetical protein